MNYRHAFHAGNHTEIFKHTALVLLLGRLLAKPKPVMVLDTHAGCGLYDVRAPEAVRTGEALDGVLRLDLPALTDAAPYARAVRDYLSRGLYPGSPTLIADALRPGDRLVACELHGDDHGRLRDVFYADSRVSVHHRDGYEAMRGLIPPRERRGLVFVDPPFERVDEAERLARSLVATAAKWPTGIYAAWYPIKDDRVARTVAAALHAARIPAVLRAEFLRDRPDGTQLAGGGMVFINPPWGFAEDLDRAAGELARCSAFPAAQFEARWIVPPP